MIKSSNEAKYERGPTGEIEEVVHIRCGIGLTREQEQVVMLELNGSKFCFSADEDGPVMAKRLADGIYKCLMQRETPFFGKVALPDDVQA